MKTSTRRSFLGATVALPIAAHASAPQTSPTVAHPDCQITRPDRAVHRGRAGGPRLATLAQTAIYPSRNSVRQ